MKKHLKFLSVLASSVLLCACSNKPDYIPDRTYEATKSAIEIVDKVLDGKMDFQTAYDEAEYYFEVIAGFDTDKIEDKNDKLSASIAVNSTRALKSCLHTGKFKQDFNEKIDDEVFQKLEEQRNNVARQFGIDERD